MAITLFVMLLVAVECICYLLLQQQMSTSGEERNFPRSLYKNKPWVDELWREWEKLGSESQYKAYVVWRGSPHQGALERRFPHGSVELPQPPVLQFGKFERYGEQLRTG